MDQGMGRGAVVKCVREGVRIQPWNCGANTLSGSNMHCQKIQSCDFELQKHKKNMDPKKLNEKNKVEVP